jgi:threonine/homoserine/homoserine lactone efflux protein
VVKGLLLTNLLNPKIAVCYLWLRSSLVSAGAPTTVLLAGLFGLRVPADP